MNKRLGIKLNLMVVAVLGTLLLATLLILHHSVAGLTGATGQQRVKQEAEVIQQQFDKTQRETLAAAKLFATTPSLVDVLVSHDSARIRTVVLVNGARFGFHSIGLTDTEGQRIMTNERATTSEIGQENMLLARALIEIDTIGMITMPDQQRSSLAVSVPIYDNSSRLIAALVVSRALDTTFLDALNLSRQRIDLFLIHKGQVFAQSTPSNEHLAATNENMVSLHDDAAISHALAGQVAVANTLITINGAPYALAHMPLSIDGQATGVVGIMVDVSELIAFQNQLTINFAIVFSLLALVAVGLMTIFVHRGVTRPLRALQGVAEQMAQGDYQTRAAVTTKDEIGQLAQAFNSTTTAVQERETSMQQLTSSLEQQTGELEQTLAELRDSINERDQLSQTLRELSSPVIPVMEGILIMPLIGAIDTERAAILTQSLLAATEHHRATNIIVDVTGVPLIDTQVAQVILQAAQAVKLLGAQMILVGLRPELAQTIIGLGLDLSSLATQANLQTAIKYILQRPRAYSSASLN